MDKQLLKALDNLGNSLEALVTALESKKEAKSDTAQSLQSGNFGKQLENINAGIKSIKVDTQKIINNQKTIIDLQRKKESDKKTGEIDSTGTDKKKQSSIKQGVATILLIALAVLAIGLAFKIVGKVDFLSVIALGLAITLIAFAFDRIAKSGLTPAGALKASLAMIAMSLGVLGASLILSKVKKISLMQFASSVMIAGLFYFVAPIMASVMQRLNTNTEIEIAGKGKIKTSKLDWGTLLKMVVALPLLMIAMSLGIYVSSQILSRVKPMNIMQMVTVLMIAGMFYVIASGIKGLITALTEETEVKAKGFGGKMKGMNMGKLLQVALFLPILMLSISVGIWLSSLILSKVQPIGFGAAISAILIAAIFSVAAFGMAKLINVLKDVPPQKALMAAIALPLILPALSLSIWLSSLVLSKVRPITFMNFLTALMISILFVVLSFAVAPLMRNIGRMNYKDLPKIPVFFTLMSLAIALSAGIFFLFKKPIDSLGFMTILKILFFGISIAIIAVIMAFVVKIMGKLSWKTVLQLPVFMILIATGLAVSAFIIGKFQKSIDKMSFGMIFKLLFFGIVLAIVTVAMAVVMKVIKILGIKPMDALKGGLVIVIIAGVIALTSLILSIGKYKDGAFPPLRWVIGVAAAIAAFSLGAFALGAAVFGPQAIIFAAGLGAILIVAGTIVATSKILAKGKYEMAGFSEWAKSVALLYTVFTPIFLILGAVGLAGAVMSFFGGPNPLELAAVGVLTIAATIVAASKILSKGDYRQGPTRDWASGVAIALGAFAPVYKMLVDNAFWSVFGMGGIGPNDYAKAIKTITRSIVTAAKEFAENKAVFKDGPPEKWAKGVGAAIGAFAPVYAILLGQGRSTFDKIFGGPGPSVKDMAKAITAISQGIIVAAGFFAKNKSKFQEGNYPSKKWGKGVGAAIGAFAPVFQVLSGKSWYQDTDDVIYSMSKAIRVVSEAIIDAGVIFQRAKEEGVSFDPSNAPTKNWAKGVGAAINAFQDVFTYMQEGSGWFKSGSEVVDEMCYAIWKIADEIAYVGRVFGNVGAEAWKAYPTEEWGKGVKTVNQLMGESAQYLIEQFGESDYSIGWGLSTMTDKIKYIAKQFKDSGNWVFPSAKWAGGVSWNLKFFSRLSMWMVDKMGAFGWYGMDLIEETTYRMRKVAKILHSGKSAFDYNIPDNFIPNLRKNMLDFQSLVHELAAGEEKGMLDILGDAFGRAMGEQDPIIQMANRMVALAKGYSALADSLIKLGGAMKAVNVKNLTQLGSFTKGVAGKMPQVQKEPDEKPGFFSSIKSQFTGMFGDKKEEKKTGFQAPANIANNKNKISYVSEKLEELIKIMSNIDKSTSKLDEFIEEQSGGKIKQDVGGKSFGIE
jgi:hypothetical protein